MLRYPIIFAVSWDSSLKVFPEVLHIPILLLDIRPDLRRWCLFSQSICQLTVSGFHSFKTLKSYERTLEISLIICSVFITKSSYLNHRSNISICFQTSL